MKSRGFIALVSVLLLSAIFLGLAVARASAALSARENAYRFAQEREAAYAAHGCEALAALAQLQGDVPQDEAAWASSSCVRFETPGGAEFIGTYENARFTIRAGPPEGT
jgi:hypothetical protein